jgi:Bacterial cellulose synthase subunit.
MPTNRPVRFGELEQYPNQLEVGGLRPHAITLDFNLPPDLFVWRNGGVPINLIYRYTRPAHAADSNLNLFVNNQFLSSLPLNSRQHINRHFHSLIVKVLPQTIGQIDSKLAVPALKIGAHNQLRFDFNFASELGAAQRGYCETRVPVDLRAAIDPLSTIDMSGYYHYMAMPNLESFARSGFPFSRMADLSTTLAVVPTHSTPIEVSTLLQAISNIAATVGYPAFGLKVTHNWKSATSTNADLLILGPLPDELRGNSRPPVLLQNTRDWMLHSMNDSKAPTDEQLRYVRVHGKASRRIEVSANGPIAAIVGLQSPFHDQRSIIALLATRPADYNLLLNTLRDSGKMAAVAGSVALIRDSGVYSYFVGPHYYVGYLPWWLLLWYDLSSHPILLAVLTTICIILIAFLLWQMLRWTARRRLSREH